MPNRIVTAYYMLIDDNVKLSEFITNDPSEIGIKALEVLQDHNEAKITYRKYQTTRAAFMAELRRITGCK